MAAARSRVRAVRGVYVTAAARPRVRADGRGPAAHTHTLAGGGARETARDKTSAEREFAPTPASTTTIRCIAIERCARRGRVLVNNMLREQRTSIASPIRSRPAGRRPDAEVGRMGGMAVVKILCY